MRTLTVLNPTVRCIGVASSLGNPAAPDTARAPQLLLADGLLANFTHNGLAHGLAATLSPDLQSPDPLGDLLERLAAATAQALEAGERILVLGGDHAMAAGTWRGVGRALGAAPGLLWIDAHLDAHTPVDSPTGNRHGMPLAALLGEGEGAMTGIAGPTLAAGRVVVVGARSHEAEEVARLRRLGVRVYDMAEIRARGLPLVIAEAHAALAGQPFGISLDIDALDPEEAPGVATPVAGGLQVDDLAQSLRGVLRQRHCLGLEIAEYNPTAERDGRTLDALHRLLDALAAPEANLLKRWEAGFGARNYAPLPVVLSRGQGCWLFDTEGRPYLDLMSAYSATSFGHAHPRLLAALTRQARRLAVTSRAYHNEQLPRLLRRLSLLTGYERVLPVNTGLEAVETALKVARKWAFEEKGVAENQAEIIACQGNFHGRSIAIVGLSSEPQYREGFGPFPPGLFCIPYGDPAALAAAITPRTAAFLVEAIQGEGGIILPPAGYLTACAALCKQHNVLFLVDEVQTGLGRTGRLFGHQHEPVRPDGIILGKALGGGLLPVSAFLADDRVLRVIKPGDHGSTFGGNPLAAAVALAALDVLEEEGLIEHSARLGQLLLGQLRGLAEASPAIRAVRGRGLFAGIELDPAHADARKLAEVLLTRGVLSKDTHATVLRLAPPLIIDEETLAWGVAQIADALAWLDGRPRQVA